MLLDFRVNNFKALYTSDYALDLSLIADKDITKFQPYNTATENGVNVLKSAVVFGGDNSGKSCLVQALNTFKNILLRKGYDIFTNVFTDDRVCEMCATFTDNDKIYEYAFKYDTSLDTSERFQRGFVYECFREMTTGEDGELTGKEILYSRDLDEQEYFFNHDEDLNRHLYIFSSSSIAPYLVAEDVYPLMGEYKAILKRFANSLDILDLDFLPLKNTMEALKDSDIKDEVREFIKHTDTGVDDIYLRKTTGDICTLSTNIHDHISHPAIASLSVAERASLITERAGIKTIATEFESIGTLKLIALASYIVRAMRENRTLIIDHLDGVHQREVRDIVLLFGDESTNKSQLILTTNIVEPMDNERLLREDQIFFIDRDSENTYLYTAQDVYRENEELRNEPIKETYRYGGFGAYSLPDNFKRYADKRIDEDPKRDS